MPAQTTSGLPGHPPTTRTTTTPATTTVKRSRRLKPTCGTCSASLPQGRPTGDLCPACAGQLPLALRGDSGRFLPGLTTSPTSSAIASATTGRGGAR